ncbi:MAG TPA: Gfo/Idh/MocA family oxidoreductase [Terriglobia bacterium]|nr:Gfo/Idh/MocA family oxidoreductase [Terriglobia bacterium]
MQDAIRVGIVGARFAARFHWEGYRRVYGVPVKVVGITSKSAESRDVFARDHRIAAFASLGELCDASDVIDICAPGSLHEPLAVQALSRGKHVVIEKPFTGYYGPPGAAGKSDAAGPGAAAGDDFRGNKFPKEIMLREALASCDRILAAARQAGKKICYAENWVYAPAIEKEREILAKTGGQILWLIGDESHSGSHSPYYGIWKFSGGGALVGKGCHPLTAALHLKRVEGANRGGKPFRPATVSARTHEITRLKNFRDAGFLRTSYDDVEDYGQMHITFDDGTVADIFSSELVMGGVHNWLEVFANNHRTRCNLNPTDAMETYSPREEFLKDVYITEKLGTKQGWSNPAPDEDWQHGYPREFQDFMESVYLDREPLSGGELARDTIAVLYSAYLSAERRGAEVEIPQ